MKQLLFMLGIPVLTLAAQAEKGQSIMFGDPDPVHTGKTPGTAADEQAELCKRLKRQMKDLEGKPFRRNPVVRRYQQVRVDVRCTDF
ncbi:MAG: hypothetical protein WBN57_14305 [Gammaproteobacteria bacterium]